MESISRYIENKLKLVVNRGKSQVAQRRDVKFLGTTIVHGTIAISAKAMSNAMAKVKALPPRGTSLTLETTIQAIIRWYRGWSNYFDMAQYPAQFKQIEAHIRRRLRARIVDQAKRPRYLFRELKRRGVSWRAAATAVFSNKKRWALSNTWAVNRAYGNQWFSHAGLYTCSDKKLSHWFNVNKWVKLS